MKNFLFLAIIITGLTSCKKSSVSLSANIVGKWELTHRYGGNIYPPDTTYKTGNGNIFLFNADGSYKQYADGTLIVSGTYRLQKNDLYLNNNVYNDQSYYSVISISNNILTIQPTMPDAATTQYDKITN